MATIAEALAIAMAHHRAGQLDLAEEVYRRVLEVEPAEAEALHLLGLIAYQRGEHAAALDLLGRAIALRPAEANYYNTQGEVYRVLRRTTEAIDCYRRAVELNPDCVVAHNNLGNTLRCLGQFEQARACYRQAIERKPDYADAQVNLGNVCQDLGRLDEAVACYRRAAELVPEHAVAWSNLGHALLMQQQISAAVECCRLAVELQPSLAEAHNNLGNALFMLGKLDEADACLRRALALRPNFAEALNNLGGLLKDRAQLGEALACYRCALAANPASAAAHSNLIYTLYFHTGSHAAAIAAEQARWVECHAAQFARQIAPHTNDRRPDRRLRIGYVSPDFRQHAVGMNLLPLLGHHDHQQFKVFCYDDTLRPDTLSQRLHEGADVWRSIVGLNDEQVAAHIRDDQIDVLVDLALHTARNRLLVFARKPAPVQASFAGYPGSTGLRTIDYRLTDPQLEPPDRDDPFAADEAFRLPDTFWCYEPLTEEPALNALPAAEAGHVTFGCLGNFGKLNPAVLALWARVLTELERSRLIVRAAEGSHRQWAVNLLAEHGVAPDRVEFVASQPHAQYLETYQRIDVGLDTFPYNGHTTSLDALWMGVPVVTLVGQTAVGRAGLSQLANLGLAELAADTPERFAEIATALARDLPRLSELRATLRRRMQHSPLMDAPRFARNIEAAYRVMWQRWCAAPAGR
jgi:predicted O-linked N-acetylglucosamine transferase (SPINDLY family)